jgi:hypothetical protein
MSLFSVLTEYTDTILVLASFLAQFPRFPAMLYHSGQTDAGKSRERNGVLGGELNKP